MFKSHFINGNKTLKFIFRQYSNKLTKIKTASKKNYLKVEFEKTKNDPRKVWNIIRLLLSSKSKQSRNTQINDLENGSNKFVELAENFSKFFCSIGENLANDIPCQDNRQFMSYLRNQNSFRIFLEAPNLYEIIDSLKFLSVNKAVGQDNIPAFFIKTANLVIARYLLKLYNHAFSIEIFPDIFKVANVIPIHKNGNKNDPNNYRFISILSSFSKIFEKLIYRILTQFSGKYNILISSQYGFQRNFSTIHAITDIHMITSTLSTIRLYFFRLKKSLCFCLPFDSSSQTESLRYPGQSPKLTKSFLLRKQFVFIKKNTIFINDKSFWCPSWINIRPINILIIR